MDECETGQHDCRGDEICINTLGSYDCQVKPIERKIDGKFSVSNVSGLSSSSSQTNIFPLILNPSIIAILVTSSLLVYY